MISREEAIERLERMVDEIQVVCNSYTATERTRCALKKDEETYTMAIEALSQPERPKGRWIWKRNKVGNGCHCVCSVCGRAENKQEPFCNCGADMRGEEE